MQQTDLDHRTLDVICLNCGSVSVQPRRSKFVQTLTEPHLLKILSYRTGPRNKAAERPPRFQWSLQIPGFD